MKILLKGFMIHFFQKTSICYLAFPDSNSGMKIHVSTQLVPCGSSSNCNPTDYLENTTCYHKLSLDALCSYNSFSDPYFSDFHFKIKCGPTSIFNSF